MACPLATVAWQLGMDFLPAVQTQINPGGSATDHRASNSFFERNGDYMGVALC